MTPFPSQLLPAFETCRQIHASHGKSYYFATRFFPEDKRLATYALYAFFRLPDEIVDTKHPSTDEARHELLCWRSRWNDALAGNVDTHPVLSATAFIFDHYHIPSEYGEAFFDAMLQDTIQTTYVTYTDLERYMYGSAAVVGLMMTHVIGFSDQRALFFAQKLGEAMQLTNFLRDIAEDWDERKRIYLPQEDLERFDVAPEEIQTHAFSERFERLMRFEIERADALYQEAAPGIDLLSRDGRFAVRAALVLYRAILRKIEEQGYNVFLGRAKTSGFEKFSLVLNHCILHV